jgi:hypothetical protein
VLLDFLPFDGKWEEEEQPPDFLLLDSTWEEEENPQGCLISFLQTASGRRRNSLRAA